MSRAIVITSGKGGVGKTTCCANIGRALAARGKKTILMEGDVGLNDLDVVLGVEDRVLYDLSEVAAGKATLRQTVLNIENNLDLLPATSSPNLHADFFASTVEKLKEEYDYVLIDCPAGLEDGFHRAVVGAEEAILVTTPHLADIRDGFRTARVLNEYRLKKISLLVNRVRGDYVLKKETLSPQVISESMRLPLCGVVPEDEEIDLGYLVDFQRRRDMPAYSFCLIAACIDEGENKIFDCTADFRGLRNRIRRWLE